MQVKCIGQWDTRTIIRYPDGQLKWLPGPMDAKLRKRIYWIAQCATASSFNMIAAFYWGTNIWKYFMEVQKVWTWPDKNDPWFSLAVELMPPSCYYLGRFPSYWDFEYHKLRSPHGSTPIPQQTKQATGYFQPITDEEGNQIGEIWVPPVLPAAPYPRPIGAPYILVPFAQTPVYPDQDYDAYKNQPLEDNLFFLGQVIPYTWEEQKAVLAYLAKKRKTCVDIAYPKTT